MIFSASLRSLGLLIAGVTIAQAQITPRETLVAHLTIIPTTIRQPEVIKVNTGKKVPMRDGQVSPLYDTWKPAEGSVYLEVGADLSADPGPFFLDTALISLRGPSQDGSASYFPVYWHLDTGLEPARADSVTIRSQASLDFTFEVPTAKVDDLTLWIAGLRVATVPEIRARTQSEAR
jgi:hypothetical protein